MGSCFVFCMLTLTALSNEVVVAELLHVSPVTHNANVGDYVTFDCLGNNRTVDFYITNRVTWTFTDIHGITTSLTYGFNLAPQFRDSRNDHYGLDYGAVKTANEDGFRFRLIIAAVDAKDSGTYTCFLMAANGSEISHRATHLNVTVHLPTCEDDPQFQCGLLIRAFNVCSDVDHAKKVCRKSCNLCPIDGMWSDWTTWSTCPVTCGYGNKTRRRACDSPAPANGGKACVGPNTETKMCTNDPCPDPNRLAVVSVLPSSVKAHVGDHVTLDCIGGNSDWTYYINNRVSWTFIGINGTHSRNLTLGFHPTPELQSRFDDGQYSLKLSKVRMNNENLPRFRLNINAAFATDSGTYICALIAENGTEVSQAESSVNITVAHPECKDDPKYQCAFILQTLNVCLDVHHAKLVCRKSCDLCNLVDGSWGDWTDWSSCQVSCGKGSRIRTRGCDSPTPEHGGQNCTGNNKEFQSCVLLDCPVDGGWGDWQTWSTCSSTCGTGLHHRTRTCSNPAPLNNGQYCVGDNKEHELCLVKPCRPLDGSWGSWLPWSSCDVTCGTGGRSRVRLCNSPAPKHGGRACVGYSNDSAICHLIHCPVDGLWGHWGGWSSCAVSCGLGSITRTRLCDSPRPAYGGRSCTGQSTGRSYCGGASRYCPRPYNPQTPDRRPCLCTPVNDGIGFCPDGSAC